MGQAIKGGDSRPQQKSLPVDQEGSSNGVLDASSIELEAMEQSAAAAVEFLRCLANPHRLMILCHLTRGEYSVGSLERELGIRQAHLSQQLARLRQEGIVKTRRDSRTIYYSIGNQAATEVLTLLYRLFCADVSGFRLAMSDGGA